MRLTGRDSDIDLRSDAVAHGLAIEEHRRVILLTLADDDDAVHGDTADELAHGVDGSAIGPVLVAAADPAGSGHRRGLGHSHEFEGKIAVGRLRHAHA